MPVLQRWTGPGRVARTARNPVILVVEDEELVRHSVAGVFREADFEVLEAASGMAALMIMQSRTAIDAVFTELVLPSFPDGFTLARLAEATLPGCAILLASGSACPVASALGARTRFIAKPYGVHQLVALVNEMIRAAAAGSKEAGQASRRH